MRGWGLLGVAALLVGCVTERTGTEDRDRYMAFWSETARLHDTSYLAKDGWHFVFNAYEVACHAVGAVEVVIPR